MLCVSGKNVSVLPAECFLPGIKKLIGFIGGIVRESRIQKMRLTRNRWDDIYGTNPGGVLEIESEAAVVPTVLA